ncbi:MAG: ATP synthase F1 subunit epsilon [Flavobacteriales bacterium]|nr:ATP synthase F1 subunit epsilon [Flavobacteriales bacterium]|tara:strand:- start:4511 stop:4753 length:243 start_codon:yes stop_codon:yes gene_type:complete
MNLEIVTPDSKVFEGEITSIALPGIDGSFQILDNHAPIVSALGTGKMTVVDAENQSKEYSISGGVVEMNNNKVIVLAESI